MRLKGSLGEVFRSSLTNDDSSRVVENVVSSNSLNLAQIIKKKLPLEAGVIFCQTFFKRALPAPEKLLNKRSSPFTIEELETCQNWP
jgi:hypothetical protein